MNKKLYVGNLPYSVDSEKLKELFLKYGAIEEAMVVIFKDTGRSKGFGFVTFTNDADATKAIEEMNGKDVDGRSVVVNEATPFDPDRNDRKKSFYDRKPSNRFRPRREF